MNIWVVRAGSKGEYEETALKLGITTIDWNELKDLSFINNRDDLRSFYQNVYPGQSKGKTAVNVGQIWSFIKKMQINDVIIMPLKCRPGLVIGRIVGDYVYRTDVPVESYQTRNVKWEDKIIQRSEFPKEIQNSLCGHLTVFQLNKDYIEDAIAVLKNRDN
jgi:restriction system protein